jgi:hypothetical protein
MVRVPVRWIVSVLAETLTVREPLPVRPASDTVIQLSFDTAVHAQPAVVVTVTVEVEAVAVTDREVGDTVKVQGAAACVTVTA